MAKKFLVPIDLAGSELRNARIQNLALAPSSPGAGQLYFDLTTHDLKFYDDNLGQFVSTRPTGVSYGSPVASAVGDVAADGVATTVARSDHKHAREGFGAVTAQTAFGAASANGVATTLARSDHTHGTPAAPTLASLGGVANAGNAPQLQTGTAAARPNTGLATGSIYVDNDDLLAYIATGATTYSQIAPFGGAGAATTAAAAVAGTAASYSRSDHTHQATTAAPGASAVGDAANAGASTSLARADHVHGREGFGATVANTTYGLAVANGTATTVSRSDHSHGTPAAPTPSSVGAVANNGGAPGLQTGTAAARPTSAQTVGNLYADNDDGLLWIATSATTFAQLAAFGAVGVIATSAVGDAAAAGAATTYARADHKHAREAFGAVTAQTAYGAASNSGAAATVARSDHTHGTVALTAVAPSTQAIGDAAAVGTGTAPAREDHKHAMPGFGAVTAQTAFGAASASGAATTIARSDHTHGTPTHDNAAHSAINRSALAAPTADVAWGNFKITNLADPVNGQDAATKNYVDNSLAGLAWKDAVQVATTAALPANTYANGAAGVGATLTATANGALPAIDGYTPVVGDRILVKNEAAAANNGIYTVTAVGSAGAAYVLTRATDAARPGDLQGATAYVQNGTTNGGLAWTMTQAAAITVGTTALPWAIQSGANAVTAGAGLGSNGNQFNVGAGLGISVAADSVAIDTAVVVRKFSQAIVGGAVSEVITHNLGTQDVTVGVYNASSPFDEEECDIEHTSVNTITLRFSTAPAAAALRVVIHG